MIANLVGFASGAVLPSFRERRHVAGRSNRNNRLVTRSVSKSLPRASTDSSEVDVVVIGSGIGGLTTAAQLAAYGCRVGVLESYLIPGGSSGFFERDGYRFDVGASMIFGLGEHGTTNLLTRALDLVDAHVDSVADPVQVHYHLPNSLDIRVHRDYEKFIAELCDRFPNDAIPLRSFYDECWSVFNSLNAIPLLSLEEPAYLLRVLRANPRACFNLTRFLATNAGDVARKCGVKNSELLKFIDMETFSWSVAPASRTPMINAGMVFSDRHYGGINYPVGGVGEIARALALGIAKKPGCWVRYGARVKRVIFDEKGKAVGVQLSDSSNVFANVVVSNATRWDTFGSDQPNQSLVPLEHTPEAERKFRERYVKSPSFVSIHLGVRESDLRATMTEDGGLDCHHILLDDWNELESAREASGTLFVSIPTLLDKSVAPPGRHIVHAFVPSWMDEWEGLSRSEYDVKKQQFLNRILTRLEKSVLEGLSNAIEVAEVGTPRTHRRFLRRRDGSYGPVPASKPRGLLSMPFNRTEVAGLYCVGDSTFPGQGLNAVSFSGFSCGHRIAADLGVVPTLPKPIDDLTTSILAKYRLLL